jgi:DNA replication licensing factor MCM5
MSFFLAINVVDINQTRSTGAPVRPEEEEAFIRLAAQPSIYETIAKSIAPSIYGSIDMKKAIACLLFGGSRQVQIDLFY